jgi:hypothetical protein
MSENLAEPVSVPHGDWKGTVAADNNLLHDLGKPLGIDRRRWVIVVLDCSSGEFTETLTAFGVPTASVPGCFEEAAQTRRLEVTRLCELRNNHPEHDSTRPAASLSELAARALSRFKVRFMLRWMAGVQDLQIVEVDSIVQYDDDENGDPAHNGETA